MSKKDLHKIFDIIDKNKSGAIRMDELRGIAAFVMTPQEKEDTDWAGEEGAGPVDGRSDGDILLHGQIVDLFEELKTKIEAKNTSLDAVFFTELKFGTHDQATAAGLQEAFHKLGIVTTRK